MSYILDALKRADNERERERGAVPGLHSQQVLPPSTPPDDGGSRLWLWAVGGAVGVVLAGLAWYQFGPAVQITARVTPLPAPHRVSAPLPPHSDRRRRPCRAARCRRGVPMTGVAHVAARPTAERGRTGQRRTPGGRQRSRRRAQCGTG